METHHGRVPFTANEFPEAYYSESFERDIYSTTEHLKEELHELYGRFGLVGNTSLPGERR